MPKKSKKKTKEKKGKAKQTAPVEQAPIRTIQQRVAEFLVSDVSHVDVRKCVPGSEARAVKPSGVAKIKESMKDKGYMQVIPPHLRYPPISTAIPSPCPQYASSQHTGTATHWCVVVVAPSDTTRRLLLGREGGVR